MTILAIDPSINNTGWAVLEPEEHQFAMPSLNRMVPKAHGVWRSKEKDPYDRLEELSSALHNIVCYYNFTDVVIETTSGKLAARLKGTNANMLLYGVAVGSMVRDVRELSIGRQGETRFNVHLILENLWTGEVPKARRHAATLAEFGLPKKTTDHETDAIALGTWWYANRKLLAVPAEESVNGKTQ